ncbi:DMT family transporter [Piscinibacter sakaiensis]|uniref:EamA domain-containing protein n=1 Tax=Piscinibacter sakaiensis TaxID=1547922 RepID=A0A0K8P187_PISS1|nr:DMT family transporter [Piscinibacter sakaiensis]GAP35935.1 hypothetical protein ISF6_1775 [Piscinibacter sakaiensis]
MSGLGTGVLGGVLLHVAGLWTLSALDATGKHLVLAGVPLLMLAWARYALHTALVAVVWWPRRGHALWATRSLPRQLQRGALMVLTTVSFFGVLRHLPLAEATALNFLAPVVLMALAPWLLHEPHRWHRWVGVGIGFLGMLVVVRPGSNLSPLGVALGIANALAFAAFQISTRRVAHDDPLTTNAWGGLVGTVVLTAALPWTWQTLQLSWTDTALLASTGLTGFLGHWLQAAAYRRTPATLLAPYSYLQIVSAVLFGWWVFRQLPDPTTAAGIALICAAGAGVAIVERAMGRRLLAAAAAGDAPTAADAPTVR